MSQQLGLQKLLQLLRNRVASGSTSDSRRRETKTNKNRMCLLCLAGMLLLIFVWTPMSVQATLLPPQPCSPFQFAQQDEVKFTWEDVKKGEAIVQVHNNTATERTLSVAISDMGFKDADDDKKKLDNEMVLKAELSSDGKLPAGRDTSITFLKAENGVKPKVGTYSGVLHVWDADAAIHLPVKIEIPDPKETVPSDATGEMPTPLLDSWIVNYKRLLPRLPRVLEEPQARLDYAFLPLDIDATDCCDIKLDGSKPLGYITGEKGGTATVFGRVVEPQPNDKLGLKLDIDGIRSPGKYTGKIDLLPDDKDKGIVTLTVNAGDDWYWPVLAILAGIWLAWKGERYVKVQRKILLLFRRVAKELGEDFKDAHDKFVKASLGQPYVSYSIAADLKTQRDLLWTNINALGLESRFSTALDEESNDSKYKDIVERLGEIKKVVGAWPSFADELKNLKDALKKAQEDVKGRLPDSPHPPPTFIGKINELLTGHSDLKVDEFETHKQKVGQATVFADNWDNRVERHHDASEQIKKLEQALDSDPNVEDKLFTAKTALGLVWETLWTGAEDGDWEAANVRIKGKLKDAGTIIKELKNIGVERRLWTMETVEAELAPFLVLPVEFGYGIPVDPGVDDATLISWIDRALGWRDPLVFLLAVVGAVLTGLKGLNFGQNFGTLLDYLNALTWGVLTKAAVDVLFAGLERVLGVTRQG